jgi:outer membrane protein assembly factor BamB
MNQKLVAAAVILLGIFLVTGSSGLAQQDPDQWGQWRGPLGTGESTTAKPPIRWSETENIRWKTRLPGLGHSTPVVWGDTIFLTLAAKVGEPFPPRPDTAPGAHDNLRVDSRHRFSVIAIDRKSGEIKWDKTVHEAIPHEGGHYTASLASASPSTDGKYLFAFFGTYGMFCLDFEGNIVWEKSLGTMNSKHGHGEGASPYLYDDTLIVNWDHEGQSFIATFDKTNGKEIWRLPREEVTSWSSPVVYSHNGRPQVIVAGTSAVRGYDLKTGDIIWQCGGLSNNVVATPVAAEGMVFVGSSYDTKAMLGIKLEGAKGDITGTNQVVWRRVERTPYVPSPLLYRGSLYFLRHYQGILSVVVAKTGEETVGPFRIRGLNDIYASPVAADGKIFITGREGVTAVISQPDLPRTLSFNRLDDRFSASLALAGEDLFLRGEKFLYCINSSAIRN